MTDKEKGYFIPKRKRGRQICDQKGNAIADMATVLGMVGTEEGRGTGLRALEEGTIEVRWSNINDAEYAERWSENVEHDVLEVRKNNRDPGRLSGTVLAIRRLQEEKRLEKEERLSKRDELGDAVASDEMSEKATL